MPKIPINGPLSLSQNIPNVDSRFGPYTSVAEANEYLGPAVSPTDEYDDVISAGMLFGVYEDDGSVTICMWTKDHATVNDFKRISHAQVVQFNGIVTGAVTISQSSGATAKTASDIEYLQQNKKFGYLQGTGYITNWVNRYVWADSDLNPYQDVLYLNIATNALYYYTGTALVALTAGSQGSSLVTSVNGQTGAVTITIPTKLSDLTNDVGFITNAGVTSFNGQTGAVTYTPPVTKVNNKTGAVVLDKTDVGLGNVDNTHDANKQVYSAVHDGSGNPIDETYQTKTDSATAHSNLQSQLTALANVAANLTGLESTNFGGFSLAADAATAVSNIPTVFTQNGYTVGQPYWFLAGPDMSSLVAYRYIGSGTPAAISNTVYDFTDFSGLQTKVSSYRGNTNNLDPLNNLASVGIYHFISGSRMGLVSVSYDTAHSVATQIWLSSVNPDSVDQSVWNEGPALLMRTYKNSAWTGWTNPITKLQANTASLEHELYNIEKKQRNIDGTYNTDEGDLDISDEDGNVLARFNEGHIKTENFDSSDVYNKSAVDAKIADTKAEIPEQTIADGGEGDLDISDNSGNVIARFDQGHIKTENFDSSVGRGNYKRVNRFTIPVDCTTTIPQSYATEETINTYTQQSLYSDNAVLYLPATYTPSGNPTKLIIYCKHGASEIKSTGDPIMNSSDQNVFRFLLSIGYAILGADGVPDAFASAIGICERVVGNYIAVQSAKRAYDYVVSKFNIDKRGSFIYGYSQGGMYAQNVIDLSGIPIMAAAEVSPVCSMRYHQWDLAASGTIGGVSWTRLARLNVARLFGFAAVTDNTELLALEFDQKKVQGYDPWTRNVENPYEGFTQTSSYGSHLWALPSGTSLSDITMKKHLKCPLKVWCAKNDGTLGVDVMKVFVQAAKNAGCVADMHLFSTGGHSIQSAQTAIETFEENGETLNLYPLAYEIAMWFYKFGGYEINN